MRACRTRTSGAQRRLWWRKGISTFQQELRLPGNSTDRCCTVCGAYPFSTTPCVHKPPTFSCPLASNVLTWAAFSRPLSCFGFSTRNDVSRLCSRGAMAPCYVTIKLLCAVLASHTPWSAQTHHPPFAPVSPRLLLCGSLSHSLPPILSCSLSCAPLSLSLLSVSPLSSFPTVSHSLSLSLSLSLSHKRGVQDVQCISIPPGVRTPGGDRDTPRYTGEGGGVTSVLDPKPRGLGMGVRERVEGGSKFLGFWSIFEFPFSF